MSRATRSDQPFYVVGSGYGQFTEPNAIEMAKYLLKQGCRVIWLAPEQDAPNGVEVRKRGSYHATRDLLQSHGGFYTHSFSDLIPHGHRLGAWAKLFGFPPLIFMQHGVIGLKSQLSNGILLSQYIRSLEPTFTKMIVSSNTERQLVESMGVPKEKIAITGLPRFDSYREKHENKLCLVFFTWQSSQSQLDKAAEVSALSAVRRLRSSGFSVEYRVHQMQGGSQSRIDSPIFTLDQMVSRCALLITDDSSVAWDVLYRGGEVLFFRPSGTWLMRSPELLKRRLSTLDGLDQAIDAFANGYRYPRFEFSAFNDDKNCRRVYELLRVERA